MIRNISNKVFEKREISDYLIIIGFIIFSLFILFALFSPFLAPYDPEKPVGEVLEYRLKHPNKDYIMGTDQLARDVYSRVIYGSRIALMIAFFSTFLALIIGVPTGLISGFVGGKFDRIFALMMDSIYAFPGLILAIALAAMLGPGLVNISVAIAVIYIPTYFRIVRGRVLQVKQEVYVEAAKALGANRLTILLKYITGNVLPSAVAMVSFNIADAILTEAGLSFLGLGIPPPTPDWGYDISNGQKFLLHGDWWLIFFPGMMIVLVSLAASFIGEGLSEKFDPRLRVR